MMRTNGYGKPVVALDIDGTLGDYHRHFLEMAEKWFGQSMPDPQTLNPGLRLHKFMGVRLQDYRACKLAYRQGGYKRWMPCYDGASELTIALRKAGAEVWICTTRPYNHLSNIDPDTQEWLRRNKIKFDDAIIYGDKKYLELKRQTRFPSLDGTQTRVAGIMEDLPELWTEAARLFPGTLVVLRDQPYNRTTIDGDTFVAKPPGWFARWPVARELGMAQDMLLHSIAYWRESHGYKQKRARARRSD